MQENTKTMKIGRNKVLSSPTQRRFYDSISFYVIVSVPHYPSRRTHIVTTRSDPTWEKVMDIEIHRKTTMRAMHAVIARRDITGVLYLDARNDVIAVGAIVSLWLMPAWIRNERARVSFRHRSHAVRRRICTRSWMIVTGFDKEMIYGYRYKKARENTRDAKREIDICFSTKTSYDWMWWYKSVTEIYKFK